MNLSAEYAEEIKFEDCLFYHVMDLPGYPTTNGDWDLRKRFPDYLGKYNFDGKKVLEIGPASGFLTFQMESRGAQVTAIEVGSIPGWDFVPYCEGYLETIFPERREVMFKLKNSFWFAHNLYGSKANLHYEDVYKLPLYLRGFDVALLGCVLLHTHSPLKIIEECSKASRDIIITDLYHKHLSRKPICKLHPNKINKRWDTWWEFTPEFFVQFLGVLGFQDIKVSFHEQLYRGQLKALFTVVGRR